VFCYFFNLGKRLKSATAEVIIQIQAIALPMILTVELDWSISALNRFRPITSNLVCHNADGHEQ